MTILLRSQYVVTNEAFLENNWANYQNIILSYKFYWYFHVNIKRNINNANRANEHMFSSCAKKKLFEINDKIVSVRVTSAEMSAKRKGYICNASHNA